MTTVENYIEPTNATKLGVSTGENGQPFPSYPEGVAAARTAYLSIPTYLKHEQESVLRNARAAFPHLRLGNFESEFEADEFSSWPQWQTAFQSFIADCDALIVACDSSRLITSGVRHEIDMARRAGKLIVVFKTDDCQMRRYWGYAAEGKGGRLLKRSEGLALRAERRAQREAVAKNVAEKE